MASRVSVDAAWLRFGDPAGIAPMEFGEKDMSIHCWATSWQIGRNYNPRQALVHQSQAKYRCTVCMYSKVKILSRRSERLPDQEIARALGIVGHVTVALIANIAVMTLHSPMDGGKRTPVVLRLWRARLVTMNGDRMLMQGFERIGNQEDPNTQVQKQEWAMQVMVDQPEYVGQTPHRPNGRGQNLPTCSCPSG